MDPALAPRLRLALAFIGLPRETSPRTLIERAARLGFRAVQLDASHPDTRPRELSRSARRDLAALLRRYELALAGVDLFIPPEHLTDPAHADRAVAALAGAAELASELAALTAGSPTLSAVLPSDPAAAGPVAAIAEAAQAHAARIADFTHPAADRDASSPIGVGVDPAALLLAGADPAAAVSAAGASLAAARLSDATAAERVPPGDGRLDELAYAVALATGGYRGWAALDLRGVRGGLEHAGRVAEQHAGSPGDDVQL